jgi:hypothetical protein
MKLFIALIALASMSAFAGETKTTTSAQKNTDGSVETQQTKTTDMSAPTPTGTTTKKTTVKKAH